MFDKPVSAGGIWPIFHLAPNALFSIAPEREKETLKEICGLTVHLKDSEMVNAGANLQGQRIVLCRGLVECLWCASYAYYVFRRALEQQACSKGEEEGTRLEIEVVPGGEVELALRALMEAVRAAVEEDSICWDGLPMPVAPTFITPESSTEERAGEMTLCALGFVLHHELAHLHLGHVKSPADDPGWSLLKELDADSEAIRRIFGQLSVGEKAIAKRVWGVVIVMVFFTAKRIALLGAGIPPSPVEKQSHPLPYERLDRVICHETVQASPLLLSTVTSLSCAAMVPHIRISNIQIPDGPYSDYADLYQMCLSVLSDALVN